MNLEPTRAALMAFLQSGWAAGAYAATPIEWDNLSKIDHNLRKDPFVTAKIKWHDAVQASLEGQNPLIRRYGELHTHVHVKQGSGTRLALLMADVLGGILDTKQVGTVQLQAGRPQEADEDSTPGWYILPLSFSFYVDSG